MPQVALSSDFLDAFAKIPKKKQKTVREALEKFKREPTTAALNYESIHDMADDKVRTLRCGIDYRAVVIHPPKGDVYLFVWVDHHDEAMEWARRKRFEVNKHTGTLQVYEVLHTTGPSSEAATTPPAHVVEAMLNAPIPEGRLFSGHDDTTLLLFGVPEPLLPAVRSLRAVEDFESLVPYLPQEASDALYCLASGFSPEETIDELDRAKRPLATQKPEFDLEDFAASLERSETQRQFKLIEDEHELADILNAPLAKWRVFLHPSQRKIIGTRANGPIRVLGGAGTGKTVVAMHRAQYLAKNAPGDVGDKKLLFTTYTRNLAADIEANLAVLCGEELARIEVTPIDRWASGVLKARGVRMRVATEEERREAWADAINADSEQSFSRAFYEAEWREVVQTQSILKEADYLRARRAGRGTALSRGQRKTAWSVLDAYRRQLQAKGVVEEADVIREARLLLESGKVPQRYFAVVADEVQDFGESTLRLLRAIVPEGPNDLFLVGDAHQRIYGYPTSLSRCGINVRGQRSKRLRLNYRTTAKIRNYAVALLRGMAVDDLDEGKDDALKGYHSLRQGEPPLVKHHRTEREEAKFMTAQVKRWLEEQHRSPSDICVVARTNKLIENRYVPLLEAAGYKTQIIKTDESKAGDGIRLASMHRVKGLEFPCVLIAGVQAPDMPLELSAYADESAKVAHYDAERRLLFVAATRARDELVVAGFGTKSEFLVE